MAKKRVKTPHQRACWVLLSAMTLMLTMSFLSEYFLKPQGRDAYFNIIVLEAVPILTVILLYMWSRKVKPVSFFRLKGISAGNAFFMLLFGLCAQGMGMLLNIPVITLTSLIGEVPQNSTLMPSAIPDYLLGLVSIALVPAVSEELLCRGILLREYEGYGFKAAVIASALGFALVHNTYYTLPFTMFFGVILAIVATRANSIYPAMIMHFANNAAALTINFVLQTFPWLKASPVYNILFFMLLIALAVCFVFMLIEFIRKTASPACDIEPAGQNIPGAAEIPDSIDNPAAEPVDKPRFGFSWGMFLIILIFVLLQAILIFYIIRDKLSLQAF